MARPMEHGDVIAFRASNAIHRTLETAAASLGTTKSQLCRALVTQALKHEAVARAAIEDLNKPEYPQFTADLS